MTEPTVEQALAFADEAAELAEQTDDLPTAADARRDAMTILLRQLLVEVAGLRADISRLAERGTT